MNRIRQVAIAFWSGARLRAFEEEETLPTYFQKRSCMLIRKYFNSFY